MKNFILTILLMGGIVLSVYSMDQKFPLPGRTLCNHKLQSDTLNTVYMATATKVRSCNNFIVTNTSVLKFPQDNVWSEKWTVSACGKNVYVPITFILDTTGATYQISPKNIHF